MKTFTLLRFRTLIFSLFISACAFSQVTIDSEDFEGPNGTANFNGLFTLWQDGGDRAELDDNSRVNGTNSISLTRGGQPRSTTFTNNIDATPYLSIDISFAFSLRNFDNPDDFFLEFSNDGGANYINLATYLGSSYANNTVFNESVTITNGGATTFTASTRFRFRGSSNRNDEEVFIDDILIEGTLPVPAPEINITGLGNTINDGDVTPSITDDTDFGNIDTASGSDVHTFTIQNTGNAILNVTSITSSNTDFTISTNPSPTSINGGTNTTFNITFNPSVDGLRTTTITIVNDDDNENPYTFRVQGTGFTPQPEIDIEDAGANAINDGSTNSPAAGNNTIFPDTEVALSSNITYTIENNGTGPLNVNSITSSNADFVINTNPTPTIIGIGSSVTFTITFTPSSASTISSTITLANDDSDENPYTFTVQGLGIPPICSSTVITLPYTEDFEAGFNGWGDGGADATLVNDPARSYSNNNSLQIRDDSGTASSVCSPLMDISTFDKVDFQFFFSASGFQLNETFVIEYSSDNGSNWQVVSTYVSGNVPAQTGDFQQNDTGTIFYTKTATILRTNYTFPLGTNARFRVRAIGSDDDDQIYIDNVSITGTTYTTPTLAPGGIETDLSLWLKADQLDGTNIGTDGAPVSQWVDNGVGNDAETVITGLEPVYQNNTTRNINFNPVVEFHNDNTTAPGDMTYLDTSRDVLQSTAGFNSNDIFMVVMPDVNIETTTVPLDTFTGDEEPSESFAEDVTGFGYGNYSARFTGERFGYVHGTTTDIDLGPGVNQDGYGRGVIDNAHNFNQIHIINTRHTVANDGAEIYFNANQIGNTTNDAADFAPVNDSRYWIGRSQYYDGSFDGRIAEVITYTNRKSDGDLTQERNRIQSYLAIKYGITLGINGTSQDYVDSDGTVIWDQSVNTGFNYDIAGIGRDDTSELNQKQSSSVNTAPDSVGETLGIVTMGLADIYDTNSENIVNNGVTFNDKEYLTWGNNGISLDAAPITVNVDMSANISGLNTNVIFIGMQRIWRVEENGGNIPTVKVRIPQNAVRNIVPPGSFLMFISDTGVFDPTADYRVMTSDGNGNLDALYDFDGTKYITFGYAPEVIVERSVFFDGTRDYIDMEDNLDLNASEYTMSAWIKRTSGSLNTSIMSKRNVAFNEGYDLGIDGSGRLRFRVNSGSMQTLTSSVVIPENVWHQVAVIYSGGTATIYIDGVEDTSASMSAPVATNQSFLVAAADGFDPVTTDFFEGNIDEVRVWDVALSVEQLRFIMNQEILDNSNFIDGDILTDVNADIANPVTRNEVISMPYNDLAGYYPMSVYTYTNTNDESNNNNQGALRNLRTVDFQTAPLPYISTQDGDWNTNSTWANGSEQAIPGTTSIVDNSRTVDWNIVRINNDVTLDNSSLPSGNEGNRTVLGMFIGDGDPDDELTVMGDNTAGTGSGITVTHYLALDGKIDLEGESQLIQTIDSDLVVGTDGLLEKDQQGEPNRFRYNYWSSPIGSTTPSGVNTYSYAVQDIMKDRQFDVNFLTNTFDGNPSTGSTPVEIADYWIWKFANNLDGDFSAWEHIRRSGNILPGEGFTMKGPGPNTTGNQNYTFLGKPNNADINLTVNEGNDYLVGNPYASAIDARQFIIDNGPSIFFQEEITLDGDGNPIVITGEDDATTSGTLYFWEHWGGFSHILSEYQGGYATYNLAGSVSAPFANFGISDEDVDSGGTPTHTPGRYIPVGQGFFVIGTSAGSNTINFNNGQRVFKPKNNTNGLFARSSDEKGKTTAFQRNDSDSEDQRIKIKLGFNSATDLHRQLLLTIDENTTPGVDWGYDGITYEYQAEDIFWLLEDQQFYVIQSSNSVADDIAYPLALYTSEDGDNIFTIDQLINVPENLDIFVHDKELDYFHNIKDGDYKVFLNTGYYDSRFEITFKTNPIEQDDKNDDETEDNTDEDSAEDTAEDLPIDNIGDQLDVRYSSSTNKIILMNPHSVTMENMTLYNILGQSVQHFNEISESGYSEYTVRNLSPGTYIIKLNTESGSVSKKIIIN